MTLFTRHGRNSEEMEANGIPMSNNVVPFTRSLLPLTPYESNIMNNEYSMERRRARRMRSGTYHNPSIIRNGTPVGRSNSCSGTRRSASNVQPKIPGFLLIARVCFRFRVTLFLLSLLSYVVRSIYKTGVLEVSRFSSFFDSYCSVSMVV